MKKWLRTPTLIIDAEVIHSVFVTASVENKHLVICEDSSENQIILANLETKEAAEDYLSLIYDQLKE